MGETLSRKKTKLKEARCRDKKDGSRKKKLWLKKLLKEESVRSYLDRGGSPFEGPNGRISETSRGPQSPPSAGGISHTRGSGKDTQTGAASLSAKDIAVVEREEKWSPKKRESSPWGRSFRGDGGGGVSR